MCLLGRKLNEKFSSIIILSHELFFAYESMPNNKCERVNERKLENTSPETSYNEIMKYVYIFQN